MFIPVPSGGDDRKELESSLVSWVTVTGVRLQSCHGPSTARAPRCSG